MVPHVQVVNQLWAWLFQKYQQKNFCTNCQYFCGLTTEQVVDPLSMSYNWKAWPENSSLPEILLPTDSTKSLPISTEEVCFFAK
jgi:hypothetical protein